MDCLLAEQGSIIDHIRLGIVPNREGVEAMHRGYPYIFLKEQCSNSFYVSTNCVRKFQLFHTTGKSQRGPIIASIVYGPLAMLMCTRLSRFLIESDGSRIGYTRFTSSRIIQYSHQMFWNTTVYCWHHSLPSAHHSIRSIQCYIASRIRDEGRS